MGFEPKLRFPGNGRQRLHFFRAEGAVEHGNAADPSGEADAAAAGLTAPHFRAIVQTCRTEKLP